MTQVQFDLAELAALDEAALVTKLQGYGLTGTEALLLDMLANPETA